MNSSGTHPVTTDQRASTQKCIEAIVNVLFLKVCFKLTIPGRQQGCPPLQLPLGKQWVRRSGQFPPVLQQPCLCPRVQGGKGLPTTGGCPQEQHIDQGRDSGSPKGDCLLLLQVSPSRDAQEAPAPADLSFLGLGRLALQATHDLPKAKTSLVALPVLPF